jgi:hypothetical protein
MARNVGCAGETLFTQSFEEATLPAGWIVVDGDQGIPNANVQFLTPQGGWQVITDLKDSSNQNRAIASPSWYQDPTVRSSDWLILPATDPLPANVCFSFLAYAQDPSYPESFEVRVSTTGRDTADFLANAPLLSVAEESSDYTFYSLDLSDYAGQAISLAIRQTSLDAFLLVMDDFRLAQVKTRDLSVFGFQGLGEIIPGIEYRLRSSLVNRGIDTLRFDSGQVTVGYQINGVTERQVIGTDILLGPNDTLAFAYTELWEPPTQGVFGLTLFVDAISGDEDLSNDTLFAQIPVGVTIGLPSTPQGGWQVAPNPVHHRLTLRWTEAITTDASLLLRDLSGRAVRAPQAISAGTSTLSLDLQSLPPGLYLLQVTTTDGQRWQQKVWKQ